MPAEDILFDKAEQAASLEEEKQVLANRVDRLAGEEKNPPKRL